MASQRNLSLDLQNSQLSLSDAVNLAVILHWLTFFSFISGIFHLGIFIREDWQKRRMCGIASDVEPSNTSVKWFKVCMVNLRIPECKRAESKCSRKWHLGRVFQQFRHFEKIETKGVSALLKLLSFRHIWSIKHMLLLVAKQVKTLVQVFPGLNGARNPYLIRYSQSFWGRFFQVSIDKELNMVH